MHREVEVKYRVTDPEVFAELARRRNFGDSLQLDAGSDERIADTYIDTAEYALLRAGYALRLRDRDGVMSVTLKGLERRILGHATSRAELEGLLDGGEPLVVGSAWPAAIREYVVGLVGDDPELVPICVVLHQRRVSIARRPAVAGGNGDRAVGELVAEHIEVGEARDVGIMIEVAGGLDEVEFELREGVAHVELLAVTGQLDEDPRFIPSVESKLEYALRAIAAHPSGSDAGAGGLRAEMTMLEAVRLYLRRQLVEILLNEAGVRASSVDAVHDMRVAIRRTRAAIDVFDDHIDRSALRRFLKKLRKTARCLGAVRDLDVGLAMLADYGRIAGKKERVGIDRLVHHWRAEHQAARDRLERWLASPKYAKFVRAYDRLVRDPKVGAPARDRDPLASATAATAAGAARSDEVRHVVPLAILERYTAVRSYERLLGEADVPEDRLHALRIDCKRLRYTIEFAAPLLGKHGRRSIRHLKGLQDHLGELNDAAVSRDMVTRAVRAGVALDDVAGYLDHQTAKIERIRTSFHPVWEEFISARGRATLMRAIAQL